MLLPLVQKECYIYNVTICDFLQNIVEVECTMYNVHMHLVILRTNYA